MPEQVGQSAMSPDIPRGQVLAAVRYCYKGGPRPVLDGAFEVAKRNGLLAQDPVWRPTERGIGALIASGDVAGEPAPEQSRIVVLWAVCERYPTPQFVSAWSDGLVEHWTETYLAKREAEQDEFCDWSPEERWTFFTTSEEIARPEVPTPEEERDG